MTWTPEQKARSRLADKYPEADQALFSSCRQYGKYIRRQQLGEAGARSLDHQLSTYHRRDTYILGWWSQKQRRPFYKATDWRVPGRWLVGQPIAIWCNTLAEENVVSEQAGTVLGHDTGHFAVHIEQENRLVFCRLSRGPDDSREGAFDWGLKQGLNLLHCDASGHDATPP